MIGPSGVRRVALFFDTGAALTQIHASVLARIGYDSKSEVGKATMIGAGGERHDGVLIRLQRIISLGTRIENLLVGAFDFSELAESGVDGLLGWDFIKQLHLEMHGPNGILKIYR